MEKSRFLVNCGIHNYAGGQHGNYNFVVYAENQEAAVREGKAQVEREIVEAGCSFKWVRDSLWQLDRNGEVAADYYCFTAHK